MCVVYIPVRCASMSSPCLGTRIARAYAGYVMHLWQGEYPLPGEGGSNPVTAENWGLWKVQGTRYKESLPLYLVPCTLCLVSSQDVLHDWHPQFYVTSRIPNVYRVIPLLMILVLLLQGCAAPVIVAGAATGVAVANDRRTPSTIVDDQAIEIKIANAIGADKEIAEQSHIAVVSYNHVVLLLGQTPDKRLRARAADIARKVEKVKRVHNEITIGLPTPYAVRNNDAWLTAKVKTRLLKEKNLSSLHVKVVTENGVTYLMGWVSRAEGEQIARVVQQVKGIKAVVKVFEYSD
ncbi:MAG TPA: BON domain-containing protein [Gammaproteobacteria bacterium]|nr:BON domain-containing protein [Gammaproteobacteria bacterium]